VENKKVEKKIKKLSWVIALLSLGLLFILSLLISTSL